MVHRQLSPTRLGLWLAAALLAIAVTAPAASASNRRVSISNYQWSTPTVHINAGEHVTWHWIGPDLMHSVTGQSANDQGIDSDAGTNEPHHPLGDTFQVTFSTPGTYLFQCKLHSVVRGEIIVGDGPADPVSEPDPVPQTNLDLTAPRINTFRLGGSQLRRGNGINLRYNLDESASVSADLYRHRPKGGKVFAGYQVWKGFLGQNSVPLGKPGKHFRAHPGRYTAVIRASDEVENDSKVKRLNFRILP